MSQFECAKYLNHQPLGIMVFTEILNDPFIFSINGSFDAKNNSKKIESSKKHIENKN